MNGPVFGRRHAQVLRAVAAEIADGCKIHLVGYLRYGETGILEIGNDDGGGGAVDMGGDTVSGDAFYRVRQIFRRDMELCGIVAHIALRAGFTALYEIEKFPGDVAGAVRGEDVLIEPGMKFKQVVNHRFQKAAHHFGIEPVFRMVHPLADAVDVADKNFRFGRRHPDDRVGEKAHTS